MRKELDLSIALEELLKVLSARHSHLCPRQVFGGAWHWQ